MRRPKTSFAIRTIGLLAAILGLVIASIETWHNVDAQHDFEVLPFITAGLFIALGLLMVQTARADIIAEWLFASISKKGGRRFYDETDELELPPPSKKD
jgi:sulfite exporter TauE/SafE